MDFSIALRHSRINIIFMQEIIFFLRTEQETRNVRMKVSPIASIKKFHETVTSNKDDVKHFP